MTSDRLIMLGSSLVLLSLVILLQWLTNGGF